MCVIYNYMHSTVQQGWLELLFCYPRCLSWRLSTKTGRWMCRHSLLINSGAGNLPTHLCESEMTDGLTILFYDIHIGIGSTLNLHYSACVMEVEPYRSTATGTASYRYVAILSQYNQFILAPIIPWMHKLCTSPWLQSWFRSSTYCLKEPARGSWCLNKVTSMLS